MIARFSLAAALLATAPVEAAGVLFDATKHEMGGNADWVVDSDLWDQNMPAYPCSGSTNESRPARFPTPPQAGITPTTPESYWTGGISAWAVELAKAGHTVESLPAGVPITFGDGANPQDLSHYRLFVVAEPQNPFTAAEKSAILAFVHAGGGLFMVADHETSDRDCDGWDAPHVFNHLTGATGAGVSGVFGVWFRVNGSEDRGGEDWFDDAVDANVETSPADPIINGPFGSGAGGLGLFGSTSMDLNPADNPTAAGHVWRTGQAHGFTRVTFATARYGAGRVAAVGDSSPADDDTGDPGDSLYPGWDKATGGVANREIFLNASHWLLDPAPDVTPPAIEAGPSVLSGDCVATILWTTDEPATSIVEVGPTPAYGSSFAVPGFVSAHSVEITPLAPATSYHYRVSSSDAAGNGPAVSSDATFTTEPVAPPSISGAPVVDGVTGASATIEWTTDEPASSDVEYGETKAYGAMVSGAGYVTDHRVTISGLSAETTYHYRVLSSDACGAGPTFSADATFTSGPAAIDLSGWTIRQENSTLSYVIPEGTMIPAAGHLVVGRNATRAEFTAHFPTLPAAAAYLDSNANGSCSAAGCFPQINGGESFELYDPSNALKDGTTIAIATTHRTYRRNNPGDPAGLPASWTVASESLADPGQGAGAGSASGVRINEMSDASDFTKEFIELYYDSQAATPDAAPPDAVSDLVATPLSDAIVRLSFTASGDDGALGTATSYDVRRSSSRILNEADFASATPIAGLPSPSSAGSPESFSISGLAADTAYFFAMKVVDDSANRSPLSNGATGVTAPSGGGTSVNHLVISQIRVSGSTDDVVEIYNPTNAAIALANGSVQYLAANGNFGFRANLSPAVSVPSHGWYLAAANGYAGSPSRDDSLGNSNMSNAAGHALLVGKTTNVSDCADTAIIDKVGYGATASCPREEAGAPRRRRSPDSRPYENPGDANGNGQDTDVNSADFSPPGTAVWRNHASTPATPPTGLGNVKNTLFLSKAGGEAALAWGNAAGATGYLVYRGSAPDFMAGSPAPWAAPGVPAASDPESPGSLFFYVVKATDGSGVSSE